MTPAGGGVFGAKGARGAEARTLNVVASADVLCSGGVIARVGPAGSIRESGVVGLDARGRALLPGLVDCHTHACFAGSRIDEWERQLKGEKYLDILASGGGIMSTVRATRAAGVDELAGSLTERLERMLALGSTTVEVKSGYGLSGEAELAMLSAIRAAAGRARGCVVATALLGHAVDTGFGAREAYIDEVVKRVLPAVHAEFPVAAVDAFCERSAWTVDECVRLFAAARAVGHPIRVHTDQFNSLGMIDKAVELGAVSVDHLEALHDALQETRRVGELLAKAGTFAVLLPACGVHMNDPRRAPARGLLDAGAGVCLASNFNPGSSPCFSMPLVIALGVRLLGMSVPEALHAATVNPARVLGLADRGQIAPGSAAEMVLLEERDERAIAYEFGSSPVRAVIAGGELVAGAF